VDDAAGMTERSADAGATVIAQPVTTQWNSLNSRLQAPAGLQLTLFTELGSDPVRSRLAGPQAAD